MADVGGGLSFFAENGTSVVSKQLKHLVAVSGGPRCVRSGLTGRPPTSGRPPRTDGLRNIRSLQATWVFTMGTYRFDPPASAFKTVVSIMSLIAVIECSHPIHNSMQDLSTSNEEA